MTTPLLELRRLSYSYGGERPALKEISLSIQPGEKIALLGNNGAGKSTFFLCCNGVLKPQGGELLLDGQTLTRSREHLQLLRRAVGIVFQDPDDQIIASTVAEEVSFGPMNLRLPKERVAELTDNALSAMNLVDYRQRPPHYLSGGEKKRVSIADILAMESRLILLDEPTAGLDNAHTALLEETLGDLHRRGMTLVISTHDTDFAWRFATRAIVLSDGQLAADGPARQVFSDSAVLSRAGLNKPVLFQLAEEMGLDARPRTMEEFRCQIRPS